MEYVLPDEVKNILDKFQKRGFQIYIVGGAVRDLLMNKKVKDWDFTTDANPEEILKVIPEGFYDNKFGTVGLALGDGVMEITTMRKEGIYKDHRHPIEVSWTNKIEEDLARRDFTVNAIAVSSKHLRGEETDVTPREHLGGETMEIVDPFHGQRDIKDKIIRCVGNPSKRFEEDALRLMRAVRIATELNFQIDKATKKAIAKNVTLINNIANERIRSELFKILSTQNPYQGILLLREVGILQIILPELEACFGIKQEGPKHDRVYDIGEHSLLALKECTSKDPLTRFAALLHDVGKVKTVNTEEDGNVTFYNHDLEGGKLSLQIAKRFNLSKKQTDKLHILIRWHMFTLDENQTDAAIRRFIKNVEVKNIDDMMAVRIGDRLGGGTENAVSWRMEKFKERIKQVLKKPFSISDLKINGNDVMKELDIKSGPKVGEILQKLFEEVLEDSSKNNREYLLDKIKSMA